MIDIRVINIQAIVEMKISTVSPQVENEWIEDCLKLRMNGLELRMNGLSVSITVIRFAKNGSL